MECKEKPSIPWGRVGHNAKGVSPSFVDKGNRLKAICAVGKQDIDPDYLVPLDRGVQVLGASGDHLVLDITDSTQAYQVGGIIDFTLTYTSALRAFTSPYISKIII